MQRKMWLEFEASMRIQLNELQRAIYHCKKIDPIHKLSLGELVIYSCNNNPNNTECMKLLQIQHNELNNIILTLGKCLLLFWLDVKIIFSVLWENFGQWQNFIHILTSLFSLLCSCEIHGVQLGLQQEQWMHRKFINNFKICNKINMIFIFWPKVEWMPKHQHKICRWLWIPCKSMC